MFGINWVYYLTKLWVNKENPSVLLDNNLIWRMLFWDSYEPDPNNRAPKQNTVTFQNIKEISLARGYVLVNGVKFCIVGLFGVANQHFAIVKDLTDIGRNKGKVVVPVFHDREFDLLKCLIDSIRMGVLPVKEGEV